MLQSRQSEGLRREWLPFLPQWTPFTLKYTMSDFIKEISCVWVNPEKYSAEGFEVQSDIPSPRRKIKLELCGECGEEIATPDISRQ